MREAAEVTEFDIWALHADHITVKTGSPAEIEETKQLIDAQMQAGYTSFAIDASHLFNFEGKTVREELEPNIQCDHGAGPVHQKQDEGKGFRA